VERRRPKTVWQKLLIVSAFIVFSPIWIPLVVLGLLLHFILGAFLYLFIWFSWLPRGKNTLFVYSSSPIWESYMLEQVLPPIRKQSVVVNWSDRKQWNKRSLSTLAFRYFRGRRNFNPLVIVFKPLRWAKIFRFWGPFKEWKHGDRKSVENLREELFRTLGVNATAPNP
jgi:hypothetical protein